MIPQLRSRSVGTTKARCFVARAVVLFVAMGCHRAKDNRDAGPVGNEVASSSTAPPAADDAGSMTSPLLGITAFVATVYKEPRDTSKKLGYLRVGAKVERSADPVSTSGCPGGWYGIKPKGYVCAVEEATTDLEHPILRAAAKRPDLKAALPYRYAFVRAVLPLYVHVPTAEEQSKSEFKLGEHLEWFKKHVNEVSSVTLGANDVPMDERGVPISSKKLGELGAGKNSLELPIGALLGGDSDGDPIPFWLAGGKRAIANISDFKVPQYAAFADRARRHTGLALVASFATGPEYGERRFAVTTDLRLAPASKIKPDAGSPWHGLELSESFTLPLAFVRSQGARGFKIIKGRTVAHGDLEYRSVIELTGKMRTLGAETFFRTKDKRWLNQADVGVGVAPSSWPPDAESGQKWIEISIGNQTLVMWEGKKPVYATLISSGKAGLDDPKTTTATIRGVFRIRNKHITATMDSNESSSVGGQANTTAFSKPESAAGSDHDDDDDDDRRSKAPSRKKSATPKLRDSKAGAKTKGAAKNLKSAAGAGSNEEYVPRRGDGVYGVTRRRGEGTFVLRDVPYIQYFESGYALHAAYWHDVFGTPRSHGCVNLSPVDAHRIFLWTEPQVPEGWHAINTGEELGEGTTVIVHE